jgi:hypothetical protein
MFALQNLVTTLITVGGGYRLFRGQCWWYGIVYYSRYQSIYYSDVGEFIYKVLKVFP